MIEAWKVNNLGFCLVVAILCANTLQAEARPKQEAQDSPDVRSVADNALIEAITLLQTHKKKATDADKEKIDAAIAALQKLVPETPHDAPLITPALLRRKFGGNASYEPKSGELTLTYDFKSKDQLSDFTSDGPKLPFRRGLLHIEAGQRILHLVRFNSVRATGEVAFSNLAGDHLRTTEGFGMTFLDGSGHGRLTISSKSNENTMSPWHPFSLKKLNTFEFMVGPERLTAKVEGIRVGKEMPVDQAGQLEFCGGAGGNVFAHLVISGQVDPEWLRKFFAKP